MSWVWENSPASGSDLLLLLAIADHADDDGIAYPGIPKLVAKTRTSRSSVFRAMNRLVESGWLKIAGRGGGRDTNEYHIVMTTQAGPNLTPVPSQSDTHTGVTVTPHPSQNDTPPAPERHRRGVTGDTAGVSLLTHRTVIEPKREVTTTTPATPPRKRSPKRPPAATVAPRFADFWSVYPRRKDIGPAEKAWTKAVNENGTDPQVIIDAAIEYAMKRKGQDPQYTKLPATWLNARSYLDEPDPAYKPPVITGPSPAATAMPRPFAEVRADQLAYGHTSEPTDELEFDKPPGWPDLDFGRIPQ